MWPFIKLLEFTKLFKQTLRVYLESIESFFSLKYPIIIIKKNRHARYPRFVLNVIAY